MPNLHVVVGAGQVGTALARQLLATGARVRVVSRSGRAVAGAEATAADATDARACAAAVDGAAVVYHCAHPAYSVAAWRDTLPRLLETLMSAAGGAGARLVVLDNLYMLGRPAGPMSETTPMRPCTPKGEIRRALAERLADAVARGQVRAVTGRASDFYGPDGVGTHFGEQFWRPALRGGTVRALADPDAVHSYHYIPDVARGLLTLGAAPDDAFGRTWMLPCQPAGTMRDLVAGFAAALGRPIRVARTPRLVRRAIGLVVPVVREIEEVLYQWEAPFVVDDAAFRARFGAALTPPDEAARATVDWARAAFGRQG
jgi:nucleoside-diphosphate-sugar epimerase